MYAPRKYIYPVFVILFIIVFLALVALSFFSQEIDVQNPSVSVSGSEVVLKMTLENKSMHAIEGVVITVQNDNQDRTFRISNSSSQDYSSLPAQGKYNFVESIPLSKDLKYIVTISAPFNRPVLLSFSLDEATINPIDAKVFLPAQLYVNEEYTYSIKLCNVSGTELSNVIWLENAASGVFKENFFERSIPLKVSEFKTIYSTLTPLQTGTATINFSYKVGSIEKKQSKDIPVVNRS